MSEIALPTFTEIMEKKIGSMLQEVAELLKNNPRGAVIKLTRAIALQPNNAELFRQRAEAYEALSDYYPAILNFRKALFLRPENKDTLTFKLAQVCCAYGEHLCEEKQHLQALEMFKMALEYQPHNGEYALKRYDECIEMIKKQLEEEGTSSGLYTSRSVLHMMFGNNTQAFYDACRALELDPSNFEASHLKDELKAKAESFKNQAIAHALVGERAEAIKSITSAIESNPQGVDYHIFRGSLYRKTGQYDKAVDDLLLAMDICEHKLECSVYNMASRQLILTYNDFAIECFSKQHYDEAVTLLNKAIKSEKMEKGLYINRGDCFYHMRNLPFALADYKQALELDQCDWSIASRIAVVCCEIGVHYFHEQNLIKAKEYLSDAIDYNPNVSSFYVYRATVFQALKNIPDAEHDLAHALYLEPTSENCFSIMARVCPGKTKEDILKNYKISATVHHVDMASRLNTQKCLVELPAEDIDASELTLSIEHEKTGTGTPSRLGCLGPSKGPHPQNVHHIGTHSLHGERDFHMELFYCKKAATEDFKRIMNHLRPLHVPVLKLVPLERTL